MLEDHLRRKARQRQIQCLDCLVLKPVFRFPPTIVQVQKVVILSESLNISGNQTPAKDVCFFRFLDALIGDLI